MKMFLFRGFPHSDAGLPSDLSRKTRQELESKYIAPIFVFCGITPFLCLLSQKASSDI